METLSRKTPATPEWALPLVEAARRRRIWLVAGLLGTGGLLLLGSLLGPIARTDLAAFAGAYLLLYGALVGLQSGALGIAGPVLQQRLKKAVVSSGVGFYGVVTLSRFLQLELYDLIEGLAAFDATRLQVRAVIQEWLIGFSVQSLHNSISAFLWPAKLIGEYGMFRAGAAAGTAWLIYAGGARVFPEVHEALESDDHDEAGDDSDMPAEDAGRAAPKA